MQVLRHSTSHSPLGGRVRAFTAGLLLLLCGATSTAVWHHHQIRHNPTAVARDVMKHSDQDADRCSAVVVVLRDVRQSIDHLRELAATGSGEAAVQAANALRVIQEHIK